jgi:hypothetical protein
VTPCPGARSARGQPGFRHCRIPHWSRSSCRPRRSQSSLGKVSFCRGREPSVSRRARVSLNRRPRTASRHQ